MRRKALYVAACALALLPLFALAQAIPPGTQLAHTLHVGESGADVSTLQTLLATNSGLYPEGLVTGYYGSLTRSAVMRLQAHNGLEQVGDVGPKTLALVNRWLAQAAPADSGENASQISAVPNAAPSSAVPSSSNTLSSLTKTCPNPWATSPATIVWPSGINCPAPVLGLISSLSPAPSPAAPAASAKKPCLSFINSSSTPDDFAKAVAQCPPESWTPDNTAQNYQTCSVSINGRAYTYPYTSGATCPTSPSNPALLKFDTTCTLSIQGKSMTVPWPSSVACTGAIPGM